MSAEQEVKALKILPLRADIAEVKDGQAAVVFAREVNDGYGDYDASVVTIVKELRELGANAKFEHEADARRWIGENAAATLVLDLIVGVAGNAAWTALLSLFRRRKGDRVRVRWTRSREKGEDRSVEWFEAEGSGEDVAEALVATRLEESEIAPVEDEPKA